MVISSIKLPKVSCKRMKNFSGKIINIFVFNFYLPI